MKNSLLLFWQDVTSLDLSPYDLIISDYEPVICYAAWRKGIPVIGISHLYAFNYPVPMRGGNPFTTTILRKFAPVTQAIGLHWHHFGHPILPPILDVHKPAKMPPIVRNKVVVYLPLGKSGTRAGNVGAVQGTTTSTSTIQPSRTKITVTSASARFRGWVSRKTCSAPGV